MSSGRSGVYLVSSTPTDGEKSVDMGLENAGFKSPEGEKDGVAVTYNTANGVEIPLARAVPDKPYRGMGKEDLLHFSSTPFWRRLRAACIAFVLLAWLALVITVVALVLVYPRCRDPAARSWWQTEVTYRIYVPSFKDSDGNGIGDLKGIESKLDYLKDLGVGVLSLSPIYPTASGADNDLAITNHSSVDMSYGDLQDFSDLAKAAHDKGMYIILDFLPGQTSVDHPWFLASMQSASKTNAMRNFYVWEEATGPASPPNNWLSVYGGPAWEYNATRGQSYLHHLTSSTPDLNLRSAQVQEELQSILEFWMDQGADGFNIRHTSYLYEDYDMRDEPLKAGQPGNSYNDFDHIYTTNQPELYDIVSRWRTALNEKGQESGRETIFLADISDGIDVTRLYGDCDKDGVQMPLNTRFLDDESECDVDCIRTYVDGWQTDAGGKWWNWVNGDDQSSRFASRFNSSFIKTFTMLTMLLPGSPVIYYGDEIGMVNGEQQPSQPWQQKQVMRTLMQWENVTGGGFLNCTSCSGWTELNGDYQTKNVKAASADSGSLLQLIKDLIVLMKNPSFQHGDFAMALRDGSIFSFVMEFDGETGYLVILNFGSSSATRNFQDAHGSIQSPAVVSLAVGSDYAVEDEVKPKELTVGPYGGLVVQWDYVAKEL